MIISGQVKWAWQVAHVGEMRNAYKILVGKLEDLYIDGWLILNGS
jgi:hypothetical protein